MSNTIYKRIPGNSLSEYVGKPVTVLGEFVQLDSNGRLFTIKTSSTETISVHRQQPVEDLLQGYVEIQGTVSSSNAIEADHIINFSDHLAEKIDLSLYNEVLTLAQRMPNHYITME